MTAPASTWPVGRARCVGATVKSVFFENFLSPKKFRAREKGPRYGRSGSFQAHPAWRFFRRTHPGLGGARRARDRACRTRAPRNFDNDRSPRPSPCLCTPTAQGRQRQAGGRARVDRQPAARVVLNVTQVQGDRRRARPQAAGCERRQAAASVVLNVAQVVQGDRRRARPQAAGCERRAGGRAGRQAGRRPRRQAGGSERRVERNTSRPRRPSPGASGGQAASRAGRLAGGRARGARRERLG